MLFSTLALLSAAAIGAHCATLPARQTSCLYECPATNGVGDALYTYSYGSGPYGVTNCQYGYNPEGPLDAQCNYYTTTGQFIAGIGTCPALVLNSTCSTSS